MVVGCDMVVVAVVMRCGVVAEDLNFPAISGHAISITRMIQESTQGVHSRCHTTNE